MVGVNLPTLPHLIQFGQRCNMMKERCIAGIAKEIHIRSLISAQEIFIRITKLIVQNIKKSV
jgi:hypothetical protein